MKRFQRILPALLHFSSHILDSPNLTKAMCFYLRLESNLTIHWVFKNLSASLP